VSTDDWWSGDRTVHCASVSAWVEWRERTGTGYWSTSARQNSGVSSVGAMGRYDSWYFLIDRRAEACRCC
jgi:hypothetical protein